MRTRSIAPLLFLSGAAALVLEVCWFRRMAQIAGGTAVAMGAVLAAVIGGMAIGSWWFGRRADAHPAPLRLYGLLELGVALFALITPWLIDAAAPLFAHDFAFGKFFLAALLLAPPAILMGGSLPAAVAALKRADGSSIGWLYAANTLGAVVGTLAAGFVLLPAFGLADSMRCAAVLSGGAGAIGFALRGGRAERVAPTGGGNARRAITLYAVSGFLGLAAEVAFTRQLVLVFGSSTYAFSTVLAVFLLGIGLGGALGTRCRKNHLRRLEWTVATTGALFSLSALSVYAMPRLYIAGLLAFGDTFEAGLLLRFLLACGALLPGCLGLGIAFPLAAHEAGGTAGSTGRLYAANTVAAVLGSTLAVFFFVPTLGPRVTIVVCGMIACAACGKRRVPLLLVAACGLIPPPAIAREHLMAGVFFNPHGYVQDGRLNRKAWDEGVDIPFTAHGRDASVSILRWYGTHSVLINGKAVATNQILADVQHLALLGHLPMAVHRDPQRVLVVGLGMGTTYQAVAEHRPALLRVVEIEEAVTQAAAYLGIEPDDIVLNDARSYLRSTEERFDVITSDPIHPWVRGGGDLYSIEYLRSVREHLAPGGVACQWLPVYQMGLEDVRDVVRTFSEVFTCAAYYGGGDLVLVGVAQGSIRSPRPLPKKWMGTRTLDMLFVAGDDRLKAVPGTILTDDALRLEFSTPRQVASPEVPASLAWIAGLWDKPPPPFGAILNAQIAWARGEPTGRLLDQARQQARHNAFVNIMTGETYLQLFGARLVAGNMKLAKNALAWAQRFLPGDPRVKGARAEYLEATGDRAGARRLIAELLKATPDSVFLARKLEGLE